MNCTPMTILEIITATKEVLLALAAVGTATVAAFGLNTWKRELRGRVTFEVARELAKATYKLRDEIRFCRSPFISAHEFPDGDSGSAAAYEHLFNRRWAPVVDAVSAFETAALEAEAMWGKECRVLTDKLIGCVKTLRVAMESFVEDRLVDGRNFQNDKDFGRRTRADAFGSYDSTDNELSRSILAAVAAIESMLKPRLAGR
jgi:hypothetical protein